MTRAIDNLEGFFERNQELIDTDYTGIKQTLDDAMVEHLNDMIDNQSITVAEAIEVLAAYRIGLWGNG